MRRTCDHIHLLKGDKSICHNPSALGIHFLKYKLFIALVSQHFPLLIVRRTEPNSSMIVSKKKKTFSKGEGPSYFIFTNLTTVNYFYIAAHGFPICESLESSIFSSSPHPHRWSSTFPSSYLDFHLHLCHCIVEHPSSQ